MCQPGQSASVADALGMLDAALDVLAAADVGSLPTVVQADALRVLERAEAKHTVARARLLGAFTAQCGYEDDGQGSARTWLRWQTRITKGAAAGAVGWARRLAAHPVIETALAAGEVSASWARELCGWTDKLPENQRDDAEQILLRAAAGGADLADLGGLATEMAERSRAGQPDRDSDRGPLVDRWLRLGITFGGAARLDGDLGPECAAALAQVLDAFGAKAGPEDARGIAERRHDALHEACLRLIAAGMAPARGGGARRQLAVAMTLNQLRGAPGASAAEQAWAAARTGQGEAGWLTGPEADAAACDARIIPVVTGTVDRAALHQMAELFLEKRTPDAGHHPLPPAAQARLERALLSLAADALSGPGGLASLLRQSDLDAALATPSLPLDIAIPTEIIPPHLRRAVTTRHPHCGFPGCRTPARYCDIHHLIPRSKGGPTALWNLMPLCEFHHLIAVHTWGWNLVLHPDGTTTATSPNGSRVYHSHSPPANAAA